MTIQSHLLELERRHEALEQQIRYEHLHPMTNSFRVQELKRKKLQLKEQIERLKMVAGPNISGREDENPIMSVAV
jgi:hypothetical protein